MTKIWQNNKVLLWPPSVDGHLSRVSQNTDPALWDTKDSETVDYWLRNGPSNCQNHDCDFSGSRRVYGSEGESARYLSKSIFTRKLRNGETVKREWLLYSPSQGKVFCFICRLLSEQASTFSTTGFNDWKHSILIEGHENNDEHCKNMTAFLHRHKQMGCIDTSITKQREAGQEYWKKVLKRIVSVVRFLASRGLPFRGENQVIGSSHNGNYLGALELISEYDAFLEHHLKTHASPGKGNDSYLSANILCDEFIDIMGKTVLSNILEEIKASKYYSISVDSTPDVSHTDQLTFTIRYVNDGEPVERFLRFIPIFSHGAKDLSNVVLGFLDELKLPLSNCRGQSYDNASNMSGKYSGLQARIRDLNEFAVYVPCADHSLNLVGVKAAESCPKAGRFFDFVQHLYCFFSASTHRWNILNSVLGNQKVVKRLSDTRWSARYDAVAALYDGFDSIKKALDSLSVDCDQDCNTRREAGGLSNKMREKETIILLLLWRDVLERTQKTSTFLQAEDMDIDCAAKLLGSLKTYFQELREEFSLYEMKANERFPDSEYAEKGKRERKRGQRLTSNDGPGEEVLPNVREKFKIESFLPIIDTLIAELTRRGTAYSSIGNLFSFFRHLKTLSLSDIEKKCQALCKIYHADIELEGLVKECGHLKHLLDETCESLAAVYKKLITDDLKSVFPNVEISLRIFMSMMVTNCGGERSFSRLKLIKSQMRSTMGQERLNSLALMCIEHEVLKRVDFDPVINEFSARKSRKVQVLP